MSVPNQCSLEGGLRRWIGASACGSTLPSHGASNAVSTITASTIAPTMAVGWRRNASRNHCQVGDANFGAERTAVVISVADARVEQPVRKIDQQVDQHVHAGEQQDYALNDRVIAPQNRIDRKPADAGNREHRLGDDRATDQQCDADADYGNDGNAGVLERMAR